MSDNHFPLVPRIVAAEKYFDVSRDELVRILMTEAGRFEKESEVSIDDGIGGEVTVLLRLNIHCRGELPESWSVALKLHKKRIDGLDYETRFNDRQGNIAHGWHRHLWNRETESAEEFKIPEPTIDGVDSREQFLIRTLGVLRVTLNAVDLFNDELLLVEG